MYKSVVVLKCLITRLHQTLKTCVPVHKVDLSILFGWGVRKRHILCFQYDEKNIRSLHVSIPCIC